MIIENYDTELEFQSYDDGELIIYYYGIRNDSFSLDEKQQLELLKLIQENLGL